MSEAALLPILEREAPAQPLVCHLRQQTASSRRSPVSSLAEVELQNVSTSPLEISYRMTVLQYLNLLVTNADGVVVSEGHFGDRFAPTLEPHILRLAPGEKITAKVHLFATVPCDPIPPGTYLVQAVYEYDGVRAVSNLVQVGV
jgi:hypothetical protein